MRKIIVSGMLLMFVLSILTAEKKPDYQSQWKEINQHINDGLPESAMKLLQQLKVHADKDNNLQQQIKIKIHEFRLIIEKDPDQSKEVLKALEAYTKAFPASAEKQLLYAITAKMHYQYYTQNSGIIDERTHVAGEIPDDTETWSRENHQQQILKYSVLSVQNSELTKQVSVKDLSDLLINDSVNILLTPKLYDFLMYEHIGMLENLEKTQQAEENIRTLIAFRKTQPEMIPLVHAELELINASEETAIQYRDYDEAYSREDSLEFVSIKHQLDSLESLYQNHPAVVEIYQHQASNWLNRSETSGHKRIAFTICEKGIQRFPGYERINILKTIMSQITKKDITFSNDKDSYGSGEAFKILITSKNITKAEFELHRVDATAEAYLEFRENWQNHDASYPKSTLIDKKTISIPFNPDFEPETTHLDYKVTDYGIYEYRIIAENYKDDMRKNTAYFIITDLTTINKPDNDEQHEVYILNRKTGKPIAKAGIDYYTRKWKESSYQLQKLSSHISDKNGLIKIKKERGYNDFIVVKNGRDQYASFQLNSIHNYHINEIAGIDKTALFTDRAIYRPGQTVWFKAICYQSDSHKETVVAGKKVEVKMQDANGQEVGKMTLTSNPYGSVSGSFVLPENGLNGQYMISANGTIHNFRVEAYKRPTFEVTVNQPEQEVFYGKSCKLSGKVMAFSGYNHQDAKVEYTITRSAFPWYRYRYSSQPEIVQSGTTKTDQAGKFEISFIPEKEEEISFFRGNSYNHFEVEVSVTIQNGETQTGSTNLIVGDNSLIMNAEIPELINLKDSVSWPVSLTTLQGKIKNQSIDYEIFSVKDTLAFSENLPEEYTFKADKSLLKGQWNTSGKIFKPLFNTFKPGRYQLVLSTKDSLGRPATFEKTFILYDKSSKKPPVRSRKWLPESEIIYTPGETVQFQFGTAIPNAWVLMEIFHDKKHLQTKWVKMNNEIRNFKIKTDKNFEDGTNYRFSIVYEDELTTSTVIFKQKQYAKTIKPKLETFRDKLKPGETYSWVADIDSLQYIKDTELMISMYDASLDVFGKNSWYFEPAYRKSYKYHNPWNINDINAVVKSLNFASPDYYTKDFSRSVINLYGLDGFFNDYEMVSVAYGMARSLRKGERVEILNVVEEDISPMDSSLPADRDIRAGDMVYSTSVPPPPPPVLEEISVNKTSSSSKTIVWNGSGESVKARTNFTETAFFYPQLHCDSTGKFRFSFTMPESMTRWNMKMLAHSKNLFAGQNEYQVVVQKDLMLQLNIPRFVRAGDEVEITATAINLTNQEQPVRISFILTDAIGNKITDAGYVVTDQLKANENKTFSNRYKIAGNLSLIAVKAVVQSENASDGEERYLAVLPSKVTVQESLNLFVRGGETKNYKFSSFEKKHQQVETKQLTLEFSSNPVWYAIEALKVMQEPVNNNAIEYFTAWYSNELAAKIISDNPEIKKVFDLMTQSGLNAENLISKLEKNSELKLMLLEETPWVMQAKNETEQMNRLKLIFDINQQKNQQNNMLEKLIRLQNENGGFSWYEGMPESRWITQFIVKGLISSNSEDKRIDEMLGKGIEYLDRKLNEDFLYIKKYDRDYLKNNHIGQTNLEYLLIRLQYDETAVPEFMEEAWKYFLQQTDTYKNKFGLAEKATAAQVLYLHGNKKSAELLIKSLRENALKQDENGMFWARNKKGIRTEERAITTHTRIMQAFNSIQPINEELDEMKVWLINQKRTQQWESAIATAEAVDAILNTGKNWLKSPNQVSISAGNTAISREQSVPGSGYIKRSLNPDEVKSGISIKITSENKSPSTGAIHWQYVQDMSQVETTGTGMKVSKLYMIERINGTQTTLIPVNTSDKQTTVQKGDKIISRIVVTTDRNYEFVALKELKAACLEPVNQLSGYKWDQGTGYYRNPKDASMCYYFQYLPKGTYVFEEAYHVSHSGFFTGGIVSMQCLYAPEFQATGKGEMIKVE